ncbi:MAG: hypothetical protein V1720_05985 [bacterium]
MNTGQMLITIGAIMLLSLVIMRVNSSFMTTTTIMSDSKYGLLGISLASSIIEEASSKAFDEATVEVSVTDSNSFTKYYYLGKETGEVYPEFDDFDDYNNYTRSTANDSTMKSAVFNISCAVCYVLPPNLNTVYNKQTWHKRISVTVTSPSLEDTIRMSSIYSYWYFR